MIAADLLWHRMSVLSLPAVRLPRLPRQHEALAQMLKALLSGKR